MNNMEKIFSKIEYLPPFPLTVSKALQMMKDPRVKPDQIAEVIKFDQSVASNVLRLCNSSYFGLNRQIVNLREAVVFIGFQKLKKILVMSGSQKYFAKEKPGYESQSGELWKHVIAVSILVRIIGEKIKVQNEDELFIAALLHDVEKLVLSEFVIESRVKIMKMVEQKEMTFLDAEKKVVGMDHAEIGARILDTWKFSEEIIVAVKKHHSPFEEDDSKLDNAIRLADSLAMMMGYGTGVDGLAYKGFSNICRVYGMNHVTLENIMGESLEEIKNIESEYGLTREE